MLFEQPDQEKSQEYYDRAHQSRERLAQKYKLKAQPEKYKIFEEQGREIYHSKTEELGKAANPEEFGRVLDVALLEVESLFPNDEYGTQASKAAFERIREKARDEISDWLNAQQKPELAARIAAAAETWQSAQDAGRWISNEVLSGYPNPQELFEAAKRAKVDEFENYYEQKVGG